MSVSSDEEARPGRGKLLQRQKRELKALLEQKRLEAGKLTSFAKAKREHKKIEARQEKRDLEEKFRVLEEELKARHEMELKELGPSEGTEPEANSLPLEDRLDGLGLDPLETEGTRRDRIQKKKDMLAEIEKELREAGT
mmetsp:Transcript_20354/g.42094  ORF Transcript_20354/g.42094 Transcript_20354/m.42094 type:complete len:139 (-) Transcript_20354:121-537(-)